MPAEQTHQPGPEGMARIAVTETEFEAETKVAILREAGIEAMIFAGNEVWFGAVRNTADRDAAFAVLVPPDRAAEARELLHAVTSDAAGMDWESVDVGQVPQSHNPAPGRRPLRRMLVVAAVLMGAWLILKLAGVL